MTDLIGYTIGNYRVESLLGTGGMGQVYRARHIHLDRLAALKVMHDNLARDPSFQARFIQEAKAIAALQHPNIVEVYDFGEQAGRYYLVLELLADGSLRARLQRRAQTGEAWPLIFGLSLMRQAADALSYGHHHGMVHRDVKPDNMLLRHPPGAADPYQLVLKITDFGLARLAESSIMTATGTAMGTPAYMSPEQCQGLHLDGRSDIYALGVVLYEITTGYLPFAPKTLSDAVYKHVNVPPPPPRQVRPDLPEVLDAIILRCLAKNPEKRFASAAELSGALQQLIQHPSPELTVPTVVAPSGAAPQVSPPPPAVTPGLPPTRSQAGTVAAPTTGDSSPPPVVPSLVGVSALPRLQVLDDQLQVLRVVEVTGAGLSIGRLSSNTIALDSEAVSRHHARVDWDGHQVTVTDVGSSNGTLLGGKRLPPQVAQPWGWREMLRIGPFWLRLEPPNPPIGAPETTRLGQVSGATRTRLQTTMQLAGSSGRIAVIADQSELAITPGQPLAARVTLANLGSTVDQFVVMVEGVPDAWVQANPPEVQLGPQMHLPVTLDILVPRSPDSWAGEYTVAIRARSRENPSESSVAVARWTVQPFAMSSLAVTPKKVSGRRQAAYQVALRNEGNSAATYTLTASDDQQALTYRFAPDQAPLDAGQSTNVGLTVYGPQRLIGGAQRRAVTVQADSARGEAPQTASVQFVHQALTPVWMPPVAIIILLALCLGLNSVFAQAPLVADALTFLFGVVPMTPTPQTAPTAAQPLAQATIAAQTAQAQQTAQVAAQTAQAATQTAQAQQTATQTARDQQIAQAGIATQTAQAATQTAQAEQATIAAQTAQAQQAAQATIAAQTAQAQQAAQATIAAQTAIAAQTQTAAAQPTPIGGGTGRIAFTSNRDGNADIYVINSDGSGLTRLTTDPAIDDWPDWSPDGARIAFTRIINSQRQIFVMNADGSGQVDLSNNAWYEDAPDWSPDGQRIAFGSTRVGNAMQIFVMNADGSGVTQLTTTAARNYSPDWSPDGKHIVFESERDGNREIYSMNADGSGQTRLTNTPEAEYGPVWSPDGQHIAFQRGGIFVMNADGSGLRQLTNNDDYHPAWSPDGKLIAFDTGRDGNRELYSMNADGTGVRRLTNNAVLDINPVWQPR